MLEVQYRMHKQIRLFPSMKFYAGRLRDSKELHKNGRPPWLPRQALLIFDLETSKELTREGETSLFNTNEAHFLAKLYG
jgi:superfamily I DNA and/or RNA helicase